MDPEPDPRNQICCTLLLCTPLAFKLVDCLIWDCQCSEQRISFAKGFVQIYFISGLFYICIPH